MPVDFHRVVTEYEGRIGDVDCIKRCSGVHGCCAPGRIHPLAPGEGAFLSDHGFKVGFSPTFGCDVWPCEGKDFCPGKFRPIVCRTYPLHPGPQGLNVDTACSEHLWLSVDFTMQIERLWRYLLVGQPEICAWVGVLESLAWSKQPEVPLWSLKRGFDAGYSARFGERFNLIITEGVFNNGWVKSGDLLLDCGGGSGERLARFLKGGVKAESLDVNPALVAKGVGLVGDVREIPVKDGWVDVAFCCDVLEHLDNPLKALRELLRVSKDRVIVYVTTLEQPENIFGDPTHRVFLPFSRWLELFSEVADIVDVDYGHTGALLRRKGKV